MGYTHFDKVAGENGIAVGAKGSETTVADSSGSLYQGGTKVTATAAELNIMDGVTATAAEINKLDGVDPQIIYLTAQIADISTAGSTFVVMPKCTVTKIWTVIDGTIATDDATITFKDNGGTALTGGTITIAYDGSAAGDVDSCTVTDHNTFTEGQKLEIITNGASTNAVLARVTIKATRTA